MVLSQRRTEQEGCPIRRISAEEQERLVRLQRERERHRVKRLRILRKRRRGKTVKKNVSDLLNYYAEKCSVNPVSRKQSQRPVAFPKKFSFIEAPDDALATLETLVSFVVGKRTQKIRIEQRDCELIDLCAESVASALGVEASRKLGVQFSGVFPKSDDQRDIVLATGLPRQLGVELPAPREGFMTFALSHGRKVKEVANRSSRREVETDRLTQYINDCLQRYSFELSNESARYLSSLVGEVIGNAEDHSGRNEWWIAGYLHQGPNKEYGDCHITIFNFGKTLSQTLRSLPPNSLLRRDIEALVKVHSRRRLFGPSWTEDALWTLYALQEGVSRYNIEADRLGYRGFGTVDMIRFFQHLGQSSGSKSQPQMCVVSGNTHILFDNKYTMQLITTATGERRRIIAFNRKNSLEDPPEKGYVNSLARSFPGTLISLRFYFDRAHLEAVGGA